MSRPSRDYTRCPQCGRRTVLFKMGHEDAYVCTWARFPVVNGQVVADICGWETFAEPEHWDTKGRADLDAWRTLNNPVDNQTV